MSDPCKVAVQAGGRATTAKQHVLLQAESEDVEAKKQTLPLPPHCPQGLNTLQKGVGASFGQDLARSLSLQWQIVKGFIVYSLGLSIKLLNANFSLSLSLSDTYTQVLTPHLMSTKISVMNHFILNFLPTSNSVTMNT